MDNDGQHLRRVRSIRTVKLFGLYDHFVELNSIDRVSIIHGPNGVGKTVLLKMVHSLFSKDFATLLTIPFDAFVIQLGNGETIYITQDHSTVSDRKENFAKGTLNVSIRGTSLIPIEFSISEESFNFDAWAQQLEISGHSIHRITSNRWYDSRSERNLSGYDLWRTYRATPRGRSIPIGPSSFPDSFIKLTETVQTYFVEAQRLVSWNFKSNTRSDTQVLRPSVTENAQEIALLIRDSLTQYGNVSQRLDQSFPQRLYKHGLQPLSKPDIKTSIQTLESNRETLKRLGLLDITTTYPFDTSNIDQSNESQLAVMSLYVRDTQEKLQVFKDLVDKIEPFLKNINDKFKNKVVKASRDRGLVVTSSDATVVPLEELSSGEQHELVLLHEMLFRIQKNTLVLIDEPELSLHIDWQRKFLPELLSIASAAGIDALVATHSPSIVGERDDLMIDLDAAPNMDAGPSNVTNIGRAKSNIDG